MKTFVIHGLLTRSPSGRHSKEKYAHTDLVYNTDDSVNFEDIEYAMRNSGINRAVPYDIREKEPLNYVIGVDRERKDEGGPRLNRVALMKKIVKDINGLDWVQPQ